MRKLERACSGEVAFVLNPGRAEPAAIPTVPLERPAPVKPTAINSTVTATSTIGRITFISSSHLSCYVVAFAFIDANGGSDHLRQSLTGRQQQFQEHCQDTDSNWKRAPKQAHPRGRNRVGLNAVSGRHVVLRPCRDFTVIEGLGLAPSYEG